MDTKSDRDYFLFHMIRVNDSCYQILYFTLLPLHALSRPTPNILWLTNIVPKKIWYISTNYY